MPNNDRALGAWLRDVLRIPAMGGDQHLISMALNSSASLKEIGSLVDTWQILTRRLGDQFVDLVAVDTKMLAGFLSDCRKLSVAASDHSLAEAIAQSQLESRELEACLTEIRRLFRRVGVDWNDSTRTRWLSSTRYWS